MENVLIMPVPEFDNASKTILIATALYGLQSMNTTYRSDRASHMPNMVYIHMSIRASTDVWLKPIIRPKDGIKYYSYIMSYVDDI